MQHGQLDQDFIPDPHNFQVHPDGVTCLFCGSQVWSLESNLDTYLDHAQICVAKQVRRLVCIEAEQTRQDPYIRLILREEEKKLD